MNSNSLTILLNDAIEAHKGANFKKAELLYKKILKNNSKHPDACHNLGLLYIQQNKYSEASNLLDFAVQIDPSNKQYWISLIQLNILSNQLDTAFTLVEKAALHKHQLKYLIEAKVQKQTPKDIIPETDLDKNNLNDLLSMFNSSKFLEASIKAQSLLKKFPQSGLLHNVLASCKAQLGEVEAALNYYNKALEIEPNSALIRNNLGNLYLKLGEFKKAKLILEKALSIDPSQFNTINNLGNTHRKLGNLDKALKYLKKALELQPNSVNALNNIGNIYADQGNFSDAITAYKQALSLEPKFSIAHLNIGNAYKNKGDTQKAIESYTRAIETDPNVPEAYNNLGSVYIETGDPEKAISSLQKAISLRKIYPEAWNTLGNAFFNLKNYKQAVAYYNKAQTLNPQFSEAHNNLGNALKNLGQIEDALASYNRAIECNNSLAAPYNGKGECYREIGEVQKAVEQYQKAISLNPNYYEVYNNLGNAFQDIGDTNSARENYKRSIEINPTFASGHRHLSSVIKYTEKNLHLEQIVQLIDAPLTTKEEKCELHFAAAKAYDDLKEFDLAFQHYQTGNTIRKQLFDYDIDQDIRLFDAAKALAGRLHSRLFDEDTGVEEPSVIFILGMPRSGTTLIEQIISSHRDVCGCGELTYLQNFGISLMNEPEEINEDNLQEFRLDYLTMLKKRSGNNARYCTDKLPHNFLFIPLILSIFNDAKIVHVKRDKAATCWSNYTHFFSSHTLKYCYDLDTLDEYYALYENIMMDWQTQYPGKIINVNYDKLSESPDAEIPELISKIGLTWDDACLKPELNTRSVKTASQSQVRKKIYSGSSRKWKNYTKYLGGLLN